MESVISGIHLEVCEISALWGFYTEQNGTYVPKFGANRSVSWLLVLLNYLSTLRKLLKKRRCLGVNCVQENGTFLKFLCHFCGLKGTTQQICPFKSGTNWVTSNGVSSNTRLCLQKSRYLLFRRLEKFFFKKGFRKACTIPRFPPRPQGHEVDFCSEVLDLSSVLTPYLTVWRKEHTFTCMKFSSYFI